MDGILVFSVNPSEHLEHLREVFERLRQAGPLLKTQFTKKNSESYLGHIVSREGLYGPQEDLSVCNTSPNQLQKKHYARSSA